MSTVAVLDYGSSNLRSVAKAVEFAAENRHKVIVSNQAVQIRGADRVIFPGQGAIGQCMQSLKEKGLDAVIRECISTRPFFGICLGLQSLLDTSDEDGGTAGLGILPGRVVRFQDNVRDEHGDLCKIPHMGWNRVHRNNSHALWDGIEDGAWFYFVHSYYAAPHNRNDIAATTRYTVEFTSAAARDNIFATQFHPEKSQKAGLRLLKNFLEWKI
ncbi:MAG: imidazole glycerol phosphate synthase subunit HisH [Gammaproteobacteria bacterium]